MIWREVYFRCARRLHEKNGTVPKRCDRIATHVVEGYAYCVEHFEFAGRVKKGAYPVEQLRKYLERLAVPGLVAALVGETGDRSDDDPDRDALGEADAPAGEPGSSDRGAPR